MSCNNVPDLSAPRLVPPTLRAPSLAAVPRRVDRQIRETHYRAVQSVAKVQAGALVAHTVTTYTASLTAEEERLVRQTGSRALEFRLAAVVDSFTAFGCAEIARMGWR